MNTNTIYVYLDRPKRYCFSKDDSGRNLPKTLGQWEKIDAETFQLAEIGQDSPFLAMEIDKGIKADGFCIIDFDFYPTLLRHEYHDAAEKWVAYIQLDKKITDEGEGFKDMNLNAKYLKARREAQEAQNRLSNLLAFNIKNSK